MSGGAYCLMPITNRMRHLSAAKNARLLSDSDSKKSDSDTNENFEVITGPIISQLAAHYIWNGIILVLSSLSNLSHFEYFALPTYLFVSYVAWQISRLQNKLDPSCIRPIYISFVPYIIFHSLSGDGHAILCGLWYASIMGMVLQINRPRLEYHIGCISICFIVSYLIGTFVIFPALGNPSLWANVIETQAPSSDALLPCSSSSSSTCICPYLYIPTGTPPQCTWISAIKVYHEQEITFTISILLICISAFMLQHHVCEYAFSLFDRQHAVLNLATQNADLKHQLCLIRSQDNLDLDSPITKVIKAIRDVQMRGDLEADVMESLDYVIVLLSSNQLFLPNLNVNKEAMDLDVNKWLNAMIHNNEAPRIKAGSILNMTSGYTHGSNHVGMAAISNIRGALFGGKEANISEALESIDTWEFDIFELERVTGGHPLYYLGMALFEVYNFQAGFNVEESVMRTFLRKVESCYRRNSYHNSTHAADVMHSLHYFLTVLGLSELITSEDAFACIIAAAIHDVDHPGFNNAFMIATASPAAIRYNDASVLEHHHTSKGFDIMLTEPGCNVLGGLAPDRYKALRASIISMVLATDMTSHFEYIAKFKNKINGAGLEFNDPKDRQLCMEIAIKCGDINNAAKSLPLCTQWAANIMEEFFKQGDEERKRGLPISMFMDRQTTVISKCQVGFIDYIVLPLYEVWDQYMNEERGFPAIDNLHANRDYWKKLHEDTVVVKSI
ncbi:hypothetical protein BASA61_007430 [Batrachochytrium salamandrivorans]|nr:hypothetical protein BASA61_007430 [Batrachochytrium salamandrivorans]KAH9265367.1 hypothetical protein BASA84_001636 [Batrachochytrium salamandrivorans]